eukprot:scaffold174848_cov30-Tisochrysis_lutea.AAC.4
MAPQRQTFIIPSHHTMNNDGIEWYERTAHIITRNVPHYPANINHRDDPRRKPQGVTSKRPSRIQGQRKQSVKFPYIFARHVSQNAQSPVTGARYVRRAKPPVVTDLKYGRVKENRHRSVIPKFTS